MISIRVQFQVLLLFDAIVAPFSRSFAVFFFCISLGFILASYFFFHSPVFDCVKLFHSNAYFLLDIFLFCFFALVLGLCLNMLCGKWERGVTVSPTRLLLICIELGRNTSSPYESLHMRMKSARERERENMFCSI